MVVCKIQEKKFRFVREKSINLVQSFRWLGDDLRKTCTVCIMRKNTEAIFLLHHSTGRTFLKLSSTTHTHSHSHTLTHTHTNNQNQNCNKQNPIFQNLNFQNNNFEWCRLLQ